MNILPELSGAGRLGRGGFWLRHLVVLPLLLATILGLAPFLGAFVELPGAAFLTLLLFSTWTRRLHDRGRSAWWLLVVLVPVLGVVLLWVECGFRGTANTAARYDMAPDASTDYLTVGERAGKA